ncbi:hypothetical protein JRI60_28935 [Archangium violaceum]|uniref:hypothetical protein n=1 Tax=Archangium violaceum TaxID=83451 RepID=UPI001951565D|nr:hypothetical protein [Archangium violaceum]QRN93221.1 hypothetical protein JRI60_28935 [Archangium violaceum]
MRKHLAIPALTLLLGLNAQASWTLSVYPCTFDSINQDQARGRQIWARYWATQNPYGLAGTRDNRFWMKLLDAEADDAAALGYYIYPLYVDSLDNYNRFLGPGAKGTWNAHYTGDQIIALSYIYKPVHVINDGVCEPGFAAREGVTLHLRSGGRLLVSPAHPLVNQEGWMLRAGELSVGDSLMRTDGSLDEVLLIEPGQDGEPQTPLDGYLECPDTFQSERVEELNRLLLRGNVPDDLIPGR